MRRFAVSNVQGYVAGVAFLIGLAALVGLLVIVDRANNAGVDVSNYVLFSFVAWVSMFLLMMMAVGVFQVPELCPSCSAISVWHLSHSCRHGRCCVEEYQHQRGR
jgi:hypothetical protein